MTTEINLSILHAFGHPVDVNSALDKSEKKLSTASEEMAL